MTAVAGEASTASNPRTTPSPRWFLVGLVLVAAVATSIRVVNVTVWRPTCTDDLVAAAEDGRLEVFNTSPGGCFAVRNDSLYGHLQGRLLAEGHGYVDVFTWIRTGGERYEPSANDAPLYAAVLAVPSALGLTDATDHRLVSAGIGVLGVVLIGLLGRRLAGERAGLIAAGLAAVYPMLWINDGMLLVDGLAATLAAAAMLMAYRWWDRPTWPRAIGLGLVIGLAGLARAELFMLEVLVVVPLAWGINRLAGPRRTVGQVVAIWAVGALLLTPWIAYNLGRFEEPVLMTTGTGAVLSAASCDSGFSGPFLGYQPESCFEEYLAQGYADGWPDPDRLDEAQRDAVAREAALSYLSDHLDRVPVVVLARVGRMWDLYRPDQNTELNWFIEGRDKWASDAGVRMYAVLLPVGAVGLWILRRRRLPLSPLVGPAVAVSVTAAMVYGLTRYRVPADVALCVLAGVAVDALLRRRWAGRPARTRSVDGRIGAGAGAGGAGRSPRPDAAHAPGLDPAALILPTSPVHGPLGDEPDPSPPRGSP